MSEKKTKAKRKTKKVNMKDINPENIISIDGKGDMKNKAEIDLNEKIKNDYIQISYIIYSNLPTTNGLEFKDNIIKGMTLGYGNEDVILNTMLAICNALLQRNHTLERKSILMHIDNFTNALMFQKYKVTGESKLSIYANMYYIGVLLSIYWKQDVFQKEWFIELCDNYNMHDVVSDNIIEISSLYHKYSNITKEECDKMAQIIHQGITSSLETYNNIKNDIANETTEQE